MKKCIVLLLLCITFGSCISIESDITLKKDGSGSLSLTYRVSPEMKELGRIGEEVRPFPLPIYKEDFEKLLATNDGLTMKSHSVKEVDGGSLVKAVFSFQSIDALALFGDGGKDVFFFQKTDDYTIFRQDLPFGGLDDLDEDSLNMLNAYCSDDYFMYSIHTPDLIKEYTLGEISESKKHLVYKTGIIDILRLKEKQSIEVKW